mmetsp:Transcript_40743/g.82170  ORF Transcript_40743/g.82170 Transcript_40743/m.82170 type:complete len:312 (+) Transcript_40743:188-1123(+)
MPVMARPRMSACTSCVPSYVFTASRFITWRITWYSSLTPFPPSMSRATRATSKLFPHELRFVMLIISGAAKPWSSSRPTCRQPCSPNATSVLMSASFFCTSWLEASGAPNCTRSSVYCRLVSRQKAALPSAPQLIPKRALFRQLKGPPKPRARGSWLACGTATSSMKIMPVTEARRLNLPSILGAESPGMSFSRMNPRITPSSSFAQMMNTCMGCYVQETKEIRKKTRKAGGVNRDDLKKLWTIFSVPTCTKAENTCFFNRYIGDGAVGDPVFRATQPPRPVRLATRPGFHRSRVRTVVWFCEAETPDKPA